MRHLLFSSLAVISLLLCLLFLWYSTFPTKSGDVEDDLNGEVVGELVADFTSSSPVKQNLTCKERIQKNVRKMMAIFEDYGNYMKKIFPNESLKVNPEFKNGRIFLDVPQNYELRVNREQTQVTIISRMENVTFAFTIDEEPVLLSIFKVWVKQELDVTMNCSLDPDSVRVKTNFETYEADQNTLHALAYAFDISSWRMSLALLGDSIGMGLTETKIRESLLPAIKRRTADFVKSTVVLD